MAAASSSPSYVSLSITFAELEVATEQTTQCHYVAIGQPAQPRSSYVAIEQSALHDMLQSQPRTFQHIIHMGILVLTLIFWEEPVMPLFHSLCILLGRADFLEARASADNNKVTFASIYHLAGQLIQQAYDL